MTNAELANMYTALKILGNRRMATANADLKVGRMLRKLAPQAEPIIQARQRIPHDLLQGSELLGKEVSLAAQQALTSSIQLAQSAFDAMPVEDLALPSGIITAADLPKEMSGDDGWKNAAQLGALTFDLNILYDFPEE